MGNAEQALRDADRFLSRHPDDPQALQTRAQILQALGRYEEGIADLERALAKGQQERRAGPR
jgi:regulator of sirC expression with transglutaminase-like and TPR domain